MNRELVEAINALNLTMNKIETLLGQNQSRLDAIDYALTELLFGLKQNSFLQAYYPKIDLK